MTASSIARIIPASVPVVCGEESLIKAFAFGFGQVLETGRTIAVASSRNNLVSLQSP
jgi:hypothetical protein